MSAGLSSPELLLPPRASFSPGEGARGNETGLGEAVWVSERMLWAVPSSSRSGQRTGHSLGSVSPAVLRGRAPKRALGKGSQHSEGAAPHTLGNRAHLQLLLSSRTVGAFICHCRKESQYFMKKAFYHRTLVNISII